MKEYPALQHLAIKTYGGVEVYLHKFMTTHFRLVSRLRMREVIPLLPHTPSWYRAYLCPDLERRQSYNSF
jgi:hypothetical protein